MSDTRPCKGLLLGGSPAVNKVDLRLVDRDSTTVVAVNRIWHATDTSRQRIFPDFLAMRDDDIEECWVPEVGLLQGVMTTRGSVWARGGFARGRALFPRKDAITRDVVAMKMTVGWPAPGAPFLDAPSTPPFAFQFMVEMGFPRIGILGIDYTSKAMARALYDGRSTVPSHWFGRHDACLNAPSWDSKARDFWSRAREACIKKGITVHNLCPYARSTPFHGAGFPEMDFEEWCKA